MIAVVPLFAPGYILTGNPIFAYNIVFFISFVFCGLSMFLLVHHWTENFWASILSGCLFAFAPIRFAEVSHLQLANFYWSPLAFLFLDKFMSSKRCVDLMVFAIFYWLQVLSSVYLGWFLTIALGIYVLYYILRVDLTLLRITMMPKYIIFILSSLIILGPLHIPYFVIQQRWTLSTQLQESIFWSADAVLNYLSPHPMINRAYRSLVETYLTVLAYPPNQMMLFPGVSIGILAAIGILPIAAPLLSGKERQLKQLFGIVLFVAFLFSLGPFLTILGKATAMPLPYLLFYAVVPGFQAIRVPARFALMAVLAASVVAALGFLKGSRLLWPRLRIKPAFVPVFQGSLAVVCIALLIGELGFKPLPLVRIPTRHEVPEVYRWLATGPLNGPIVELPLGQDFWLTLKYMYFSTYHWLPLVNGTSRFVPPTQRWLNSVVTALPSPEAAGLLSALGVRGVIVHTDQLAPDEAARWRASNLAGSGVEEVARFGADAVYKLAAVEVAHQVQVELAMPEQLPIGEMIQLPAGALMKAKLLAEGKNGEYWSHPLPIEPTEAIITWTELQTGRTLIQRHNVELPLALRAAEVWSTVLALSTPPSPGRYALALSLPSLGGKIAPKRVEIVPSSAVASLNAPPSLSAVYVLEEPALQARTSGVFDISLLVTNSGRVVWLAHTKDERGLIRLGWRWFRGNEQVPFQEGRQPLQHDVFPGQAYRFRTTINAPPEPGQYRLELGLVSERVTWFSDQGVPPVQFDVHVQLNVDIRVQGQEHPVSR
jgi:hypothetical protein